MRLSSCSSRTVIHSTRPPVICHKLHTLLPRFAEWEITCVQQVCVFTDSRRALNNRQSLDLFSYRHVTLLTSENRKFILSCVVSLEFRKQHTKKSRARVNKPGKRCPLATTPLSFQPSNWQQLPPWKKKRKMPWLFLLFQVVVDIEISECVLIPPSFIFHETLPLKIQQSKV